ncbi:GIY-YIG nuclease family protein [Aspergillus foveolatus]|uniref:GIY-YIG nuclease family protein n=1 Tax=Aspergillus foveolatus TaxID=210207 RepID=UPI003CCD68C9
MASAADLISTPTSSRESPSGTSTVVSTTPSPLAGSSELVEYFLPETPSPCASKLVRRAHKHASQSQRAIPYNRITKEFARLNRSPKFAELIQKACGEISPRETKEAVRGVPNQPSIEDNEHSGEEIDYQQKTEERQPTPPEKSTADDASSSESARSPPPSPPSPSPSPSFTPKRHTIQEIFYDMKKVMRNSYKAEMGHAYVLYDDLTQNPTFKLGSSTQIPERMRSHKLKCRPSSRSIQRPSGNILAPMRLERLAQRELQNFKYDMQCRCGTEHTEYFWGSKDVGVEVLDFWSEWLQGKGKGELKDLEPYDRSGRLKDFWADRLDLFQASINEYFRCGDPQCAESQEDARACQACLRAGWRKWAEPTRVDELEYACRMSISSKDIRHIIQSTITRNIFGVSFLIFIVSLISHIVSAWQWISNPRVFLWVIPLRLGSSWVGPGGRVPDLASPRLLLWILDMTFIIVCIYTRLQQDGASRFTFLVPHSSPSLSPGFKNARGKKRPSLDAGEALEREGEVEAPAVGDVESSNGRTMKGSQSESGGHLECNATGRS